MLELPEALTLARQVDQALTGAEVARVFPPTKAHKFCWYQGEPQTYDARLQKQIIRSAEGFGIFMEMTFSDGLKLCLNDGVNLRLLPAEDAPKDYQLLILLADGRALVFTVAMYGSILLHNGTLDNEYYLKSKAAVSPFSDAFAPYFRQTLAAAKPTLSMKAFLATEQRFCGLGNGVLQDILFAAGLHPKRKLSTLSDQEREELPAHIVNVLRDMTDKGGRDTERDLWGAPGGYRTAMSRNALPTGCPRCGGPITKEAYLGGAVYYCPRCQPLGGTK